MRIPIPAALAVVLLAAACQSSPSQHVSSAPGYPGSQLDARGYRIDAGSYGTPQPAFQSSARTTTPPRTGARAPVAWTDRGYSYDAWGNLVSAPR